MSFHTLTDADLVALVRSNHQEAFTELMRRYQAMALALAFQCVQHPETAQDLVQEALLQAYLSLDQLRDPARFRAWFYGIVLNVCRAFRRMHSTPLLSLEALASWWALPDPFDLEAELEAQERQRLIHDAVQALSPKNRLVMRLFYFEECSHQEIAEHLQISLVAVKGRLHKGRQQLRQALAPVAPTFHPSPSLNSRRTTMFTVKLVRVVPHELRMLVVLLDEAEQRVLPLWLRSFEAAALHKLSQVSPGMTEPLPPGIDPTSGAFIAQLLQAGGVTIPQVRIEALQDQVLYANVLVQGAQGAQTVKARLGHALVLAMQLGSTITVADEIMAQLSVSLSQPDAARLEQQLDHLVQRLQSHLPTPQQAPRIREPQNMDFAHELERWELRGSFMHESSPTQWPDYRCGTEPTGRHPGEMAGYLRAQIAQPTGFADLRQAILADDFRGKRMRVSADLKTQDVQQQAGLYLRVVDPGKTKRPEEREQTTLQGTQEWAHYETRIEVPPESVFVLFGISLTGSGQVWATNIQVEAIS